MDSYLYIVIFGFQFNKFRASKFLIFLYLNIKYLYFFIFNNIIEKYSSFIIYWKNDINILDICNEK